MKEKDQQIQEMSEAKKDADKKISLLEEQIEDLRKAIEDIRLMGPSSSGSAYEAMDYEVETIQHNVRGEVDAAAMAKILSSRAKDGWKLHSLINDEGGRMLASMGTNASFSLASGAKMKEDRVIMVFEKPKAK